jgi:hypothetical protein
MTENSVLKLYDMIYLKIVAARLNNFKHIWDYLIASFEIYAENGTTILVLEHPAKAKQDQNVS